MSDARPITNITDFVCGNCWGTFSRNDPGVQADGQIICPHCKTPLPSDDAESQLAALVRSSPSAVERDSAEYEVPAHSPSPAATTLRDTTDLREPASLGDRAAPPRAPTGWLPPDQLDAPAAALGPSLLHPSSGFVVGEADDDFGAPERTLSGSQDDDALLRAVRETSPVPRAFIAGEELSVAVDEPTPIDIQAMADADEELGLGVSAPVEADAAPEDDRPRHDPDLAHRDWKLKAMGITYNFHGLDPLFSWAANKSGQAMALSHDGEVWKDFHSFYASIRVGLSVRQAFDEAPDPGSAAPPPSTPRVTRTMNQIRPELPELEGLRMGGGQDLSPARAPSTASLAARSASGPNPVQKPGITSSSQNPVVRGASQPSSTSIPVSARPNSTGRNQPIGPTSSPSKRMPVAAATPEPGPNKALIGGIVAVVVVLIAVAALHFTHVITIPGLR